MSMSSWLMHWWCHRKSAPPIISLLLRQLLLLFLFSSKNILEKLPSCTFWSLMCIWWRSTTIEHLKLKTQLPVLAQTLADAYERFHSSKRFIDGICRLNSYFNFPQFSPCCSNHLSIGNSISTKQKQKHKKIKTKQNKTNRTSMWRRERKKKIIIIIIIIIIIKRENCLYSNRRWERGLNDHHLLRKSWCNSHHHHHKKNDTIIFTKQCLLNRIHLVPMKLWRQSLVININHGYHQTAKETR